MKIGPIRIIADPEKKLYGHANPLGREFCIVFFNRKAFYFLTERDIWLPQLYFDSRNTFKHLLELSKA